VAMGYGGSRKDAGEAVGGRGDGGVDGIIKEDRLGLDAIYLQAKRWEGTVGRQVVQAFAGMSEKKAVPPEENARIVAGTLEGESEIIAGLGKRFRNADEFIDHLDKL